MDYLKMLDTLIKLVGNVTLAEAKTWAQEEENAEKLRAEGHEDSTEATKTVD